MGILGDISGRKPTDPLRSDPAGSGDSGAVSGSDAPGEPKRGNDKSVGDVPLRITKKRIEAEWEEQKERNRLAEAPNNAAVTTPQAPPGGRSSTGEADRQEQKEGRLEDGPARGATDHVRVDEQESRIKHPSGAAVQPAHSRSISGKSVDEREKKAGDEPVATAVEAGRTRPRSASKALGAAVVLLALALAGVTVYGYLTLRQNGIGLAQLPGIAQLVGTLQSRLSAAETKMQDLTANWASLSQQVAALSARTGSGLENVRRHAEQLIMQEEERMEGEMAKRDQAINARFAQVESEQQAENARLTQVQDWVQKNVEVARQEVAAERHDRERDLKALRQDVDQNHDNLQTFARKLDRQRVDFETAKNQQRELVPGISLTVTRTDARYQRFDGYLELVEDSRTLWLSKVSVQQAVPFYAKQGAKPYDLVVTTVNHDGVVGYLLVPGDKNPGEGEATYGSLASGTGRSSGGAF